MFDVPPSLPSQFSLHFSLPKQTLADSGTSNIKVNQTQVSDQMGHPVECLIVVEEAMPHPVINQTLLVSLQVWSRCTIYSALISPLSAFLPPSQIDLHVLMLPRAKVDVFCLLPKSASLRPPPLSTSSLSSISLKQLLSLVQCLKTKMAKSCGLSFF